MYIGNDMTQLDDYGIQLLTNPEVIAVNQAGRPAHPVSTASPRQTWYAANPDGSVTVAVFNLGQTDADMKVSFADIGLEGSAKVRDLWAQEKLGTFDGEFVAKDVPIHGTRLFTFTPAKGATVTLNDDDARLSYDGAWSRNGGEESVAASQPLTVSVFDSRRADRRLAPARRTCSRSTTMTRRSSTPATGATAPAAASATTRTTCTTARPTASAFEYSFVGTGIDWVTETHESQGDAEVYVDGVLMATVSTYLDPSQGRGVQQVVYSARDSPTAATRSAS